MNTCYRTLSERLAGSDTSVHPNVNLITNVKDRPSCNPDIFSDQPANYEGRNIRLEVDTYAKRPTISIRKNLKSASSVLLAQNGDFL